MRHSTMRFAAVNCILLHFAHIALFHVNYLHYDALCGTMRHMRDFKEFIEARMLRPEVGLNGPTDMVNKGIVSQFNTYLKLLEFKGRESQSKTKEKFAHALKFREWNDLMLAYAANDVTYGLLHSGLKKNMPPLGVDQRPIILNPIYEIEVAAATWSHVPIAELNADDPMQRAILEDGRFELRIVGDCMEPSYPDGSIVRCRMMRSADEAIPSNNAYIFCRDDGTATFKVLVAMRAENYVLAAVNQKKYPGTFKVRCEEIVRVAKAVGIVSVAPDISLRIKK